MALLIVFPDDAEDARQRQGGLDHEPVSGRIADGMIVVIQNRAADAAPMTLRILEHSLDLLQLFVG